MKRIQCVAFVAVLFLLFLCFGPSSASAQISWCNYVPVHEYTTELCCNEPVNCQLYHGDAEDTPNNVAVCNTWDNWYCWFSCTFVPWGCQEYHQYIRYYAASCYSQCSGG